MEMNMHNLTKELIPEILIHLVVKNKVQIRSTKAVHTFKYKNSEKYGIRAIRWVIRKQKELINCEISMKGVYFEPLPETLSKTSITTRMNLMILLLTEFSLSVKVTSCPNGTYKCEIMDSEMDILTGDSTEVKVEKTIEGANIIKIR